MKFREFPLKSGKLTLGKDRESNEELVKKFEGKKNVILHTKSPGSPFGVIAGSLNPIKPDIAMSGAIVARYSQDWRDNKKDIAVNVFTGKDVYKSKEMPTGTFGVKKQKTIIVKKKEILKLVK